MDYSIVNSENAQLLQAIIDNEPSYTKETHSRNAEILKSIINDTEYTEPPQSEIEELLLELKEHIHEDVVVVPLSVTENGIYSEEGKAYTPVSVEVQPPANSYQLKSITTPTSLATFEASEMPMPKLKVSVEAKQDLHGYDKPWVGGAGKNKINPNDLTVFSSDRYISTANYSIEGKIAVQPNTIYTISFDRVNGDGRIYSFDANQNRTEISTIFVKSISFTTPSDAVTISFYSGIDNSGGVTVDNAKAQLELGSTATSYEPYSNICPISGWDEANITDTDDVDNPTVTQTTTISLGQTVYGGELDVVNGTSGNKVTHQIETISGGITRTDSSGYLFVVKDLDVPDITDYETVTPYIISNYLTPYSVNDLRANAVFGFTQYNKRLYIRLGADITTVADANAYLASNPLQIKYELATPTTLTTQPTPIKSLNGINNLSVDCGEIIDGEYFKALGGE